MIKVLLADFLYDNDKGPSYKLVPLNIGYIVSYANKVHGDDFKFKLFRNVDDFIEEINNNECQIVALSQYIWNDDLTKHIIKWIKTVYPQIIVVTGGPMVGSTEENVEDYLNVNKCVDFCVPVYGEYGFSQILNRYKDAAGDLSVMKGEAIRGVSFVKENDFIHSFVDQLIVKPSDIPSPYLTGLLDRFLADGYSPIIQGMRGCPYSCSFCFASKLKIGQFSDERVMAEIDYIYARTDSSALAVTDDNFGLYKRDVIIAKKIKSIYDERGYPNKLLLYYSKKPTKTVQEISKIMGNLAPFFISYQSRNEETLKVIDRYNLVDDNSKVISEMCRKNGIDVASEMIFGLPHETKESFMSGVEDLYRLDADIIAIYHCKYFNGTDLATSKSRSKFNIKTMHRFYEDNFQIFNTNTDYGEIVACETDEIPVSSDSYSFQDFLDIRKLGFWLELFFAKRTYYEVLKHLENYGISPFKLINDLVEYDSMPENLKLFFFGIEEQYRNELYESHRDLKEDYKRIIKDNPEFKSIKINLYYGYLLIFSDIRVEFNEYMKELVKEIAKEELDQEGYFSFLQPLDELFGFQLNRVVDLGGVENVIGHLGDGDGYDVQSAIALNQSSDNAQRYMLESRDSTRHDSASNISQDLDNICCVSYEYSYDFNAWVNEGYTKKIGQYKVDSTVRIQFYPKNVMQYAVFLRSVSAKLRPFVWHNYILSGNLRTNSVTLSEK